MLLIELNELTNGGEVRNLSGHERGQAARAKFGLADLDQANERVVISIPDFIYTITPSFFQGMFAESVRQLGGRDKFLDRYQFNADPVVLQQIDRGIKASLVERRPFMTN
ncbi:MAG: hypothetical protein JJ866_24855 [Roseibium sp.]|uniref:hypothetical protein n=1 Tax=Roseibium sp. TaxID=1936156 RepID=UPI001B2A2344|nr:hypothetical protein [Roseibium sp.]MBO6510893.1 hypothetical protein [Roseibium sp.]MBO6895189.1 hypothetical protein [Roseibium sp.]